MPILGVIGGAVGGIFGAIGGNSQASAERYAADLQYKAEQQALQQEQQQYGQNQQNLAPFIQAGQGATTSLSDLMSVPGQGLLQPWTQQFQAPTLDQAKNNPGYQFTLDEGLKAMQNSAAARGGLLSGATQKALNNYGQQSATQNYQNVYNNLLNQYQMGYQQFQGNQANTYNRLLGLSSQGQQAAIGAGQLGQQSTQSMANTMQSGAQAQGGYLSNAAYQGAAGLNALGTGIGGGIQTAGAMQQLSQLMQANSSNGGNYGYSGGGPSSYGSANPGYTPPILQPQNLGLGQF
jgi:hypothetical protein